MDDSLASDAEPDENLRPAAAIDIHLLQRELETLYRSHCGKFVGYFRNAGVNEALSRELAQETFILALRGLAKFQGDSKLSTWLWAIAKNVLLGHWRSAQPVGAAGDEEPVDPDTLSSSVAAHPTGMSDCVRRGFAAFAADHPERAQAVYLAVVEGYTAEELARHLGRTPHAATQFLSQAKAKLRPYIEGCNEH
jgi:RNA polymerase sigma-70 factor (ECF subfamily)